MSLSRRMAVPIFLFPIIFILAVPAPGQSSDTCLNCHGRSTLQVTKLGRTYSLFVDGAILEGSAHASLTCDNCHLGLNPGKIPHADAINPVQISCSGMNASELALMLLAWEQKKQELDLMEAEIETAVLEIGETQTVGNVRASYRKGRRVLDWALAGKDADPGIIADYTTEETIIKTD